MIAAGPDANRPPHIWLEPLELELSDMNENTPEENKKTAVRRRPSTGVIAASAVAAVAIVGAAGVYATGALSGNGTAASPGDCKAAIAKGEKLKPLLTGDVAALAARSEPTDLGSLGFNDGDGNAMTLADTGGKLRLVNLWATWCAPCRAEMPELDELEARKGGGDFQVVAVSVDTGSDAKPRGFFEEIGVKHLDLYHDPSMGAFNGLKKEGLAYGLPVTLLVDEDNCVIANMNGPAAWSSPDAVKLIDAAIGAD